MRGSSLAGSLAFALLAGLAAIPWMMVWTGVVTAPWAVAGYALATAGAYLVWIAPSWTRGLAAGGLASVLGLAAAIFAPTPSVLLIVAAVILAVLRSGWLFASRPARALVTESALVGGGLVFASTLAGPSFLSVGLAFWGFFLLQSVYFLIGGITLRSTREPATDAFDAARRRALRLMEEPTAPSS